MALAHFSDRANFQAGQAWWTSMAAYALSWPRHLRLEPWEKRYGCRHDRCPKTRPASLAEQAQVHAYVRARHVIQQGLESAESPKTWGVERCDALQCVLHWIEMPRAKGIFLSLCGAALGQCLTGSLAACHWASTCSRLTNGPGDWRPPFCLPHVNELACVGWLTNTLSRVIIAIGPMHTRSFTYICIHPHWLGSRETRTPSCMSSNSTIK